MAATNVISNQPHKSWDISSGSDDGAKLNEDLAKLRTLITQSQTQSVESEKYSSYGSSTITQCLHEEREENQRLRAKIKRIESQNGGALPRQNSTHHNRDLLGKLKSSSGYSKQMVDNLIRENMKLRSSVKSFTRNPEALDRLTQEKEELELKLNEANVRINSLVGELEYLRSQIGASPHDKEVKIVNLTQKVEKLERERECSEERCQSLLEESAVLRRQLTELAEMCQEFAKKLSEKEQQLSKQQQVTVDKSLEKMSVNGPSYKDIESQLQQQRKRCQELQAHITMLVKQRDDYSATNARMQTQAEEKERKIIELQEEVQTLHNTQVSSESSASSDLAEVFATVDKLNVEKSQMQLENQHLREELTRVREEMTRLRNQPRPRQVDEEHVQMLEQQIQICTEDFQQERGDREKAQAKVAELETEVDLLKRQLEQFQMSRMARLRAQRDNALNYYRNQHYSNYGRGAPSGMRARGMIVADGDDEEVDPNLEEDQIDSLQSSVSLQAHASANELAEPEPDSETPTSSSRDDALQCPRCKKEYPAEEHNGFLEHIDECCS